MTTAPATPTKKRPQTGRRGGTGGVDRHDRGVPAQWPLVVGLRRVTLHGAQAGISSSHARRATRRRSPQKATTAVDDLAHVPVELHRFVVRLHV